MDLKENRRLLERGEDEEGALLHFMFLKKAIEEALVSMFAKRFVGLCSRREEDAAFCFWLAKREDEDEDGE